MTETKLIDKNVSSIDLLWNQVHQKLDAWLVQASYREDVLLQSTKQFAKNMKRNQSNVRELINQFTNELSDWEFTSREELLTVTTSLQAIFPLISYEEINKQLDLIKNKARDFVSTPIDNFTNDKFVEDYQSLLERYIEIRRNNRNLFVNRVKETASILQINQTQFFHLITDQVKKVIFPLHRYM